MRSLCPPKMEKGRPGKLIASHLETFACLVCLPVVSTASSFGVGLWLWTAVTARIGTMASPPILIVGVPSQGAEPMAASV
jgi:hypothetical protein